MHNYWSVIPPNILSYWQYKYKEYLWCSISDEWVIFYENGRLDCFHPSGDRLARHNIKDNVTVYCGKNNKFLTEKEYINQLLIEE